MSNRIPVWATQTKTKNGYRYSHRYGQKPAKNSWQVGYFQKTFNQETGNDEDWFDYHEAIQASSISQPSYQWIMSNSPR